MYETRVARGAGCAGCGAPLDAAGQCTGRCGVPFPSVAADATASPGRPVYAKVAHADSGATLLWMITCDEGWRSTIVCDGMYGPVADWLLGVLGRRPYAGAGVHLGGQAPPGS